MRYRSSCRGYLYPYEARVFRRVAAIASGAAHLEHDYRLVEEMLIAACDARGIHASVVASLLRRQPVMVYQGFGSYRMEVL